MTDMPTPPRMRTAEEDDAWEAMLTDSLWGVYQMIGKLNPRLYVLTRARGLVATGS
jgi:hypothetical protein